MQGVVISMSRNCNLIMETLDCSAQSDNYDQQVPCTSHISLGLLDRSKVESIVLNITCWLVLAYYLNG